MPAIPLYTQAIGLDTKQDVIDIPYNAETGATALSKAINVRINKAGRVERCHGYTAILEDGSYHSGFSDGGDAFAMKGTSLYRFNPEETITGIRSGMTGDKVSYAQHGDDTYYTDGMYQGRINNAVSYTWTKGEYLGPDGNTAEYFGPPIFLKLAIFNGRLVGVPKDDPRSIIWSEVGQLNLFKRGTSFRRFESEVIMVLPVETGIFISTHHAIHFLAGDVPDQFKLITKKSYPAVEWSETPQRVTGSDLGLEADGEHRLFRAKKGAMAALANGALHNMTEDRIKSSIYGKGTSILVDDYYIHSIF